MVPLSLRGVSADAYLTLRTAVGSVAVLMSAVPMRERGASPSARVSGLWLLCLAAFSICIMFPCLNLSLLSRFSRV